MEWTFWSIYYHSYNFQFAESNYEQFLIIVELREIFFGCMCSVSVSVSLSFSISKHSLKFWSFPIPMKCDSDFPDVLTVVLNMATTKTELDMQSYDGIIYCWLKAIGVRNYLIVPLWWRNITDPLPLISWCIHVAATRNWRSCIRDVFYVLSL